MDRSQAVDRDGILFIEVYEDLKGRICGGEFPLDGRMPTEAELMEGYDVSITTVRKAMQRLSDEGIVSKRRGLGTFLTAYPKQSIKTSAMSKEFRVAVLMPDTMRLTKDGDSRHWALNLRRLNGIYLAAGVKGSSVFVHGFGESLDYAVFDGAIVMPAYAVEMDKDAMRLETLERLDAERIPAVTISEFDPRFTTRLWVAEMTELEFFKATVHLLDRGHRRIALLGPRLDWSNPRLSGYRKALDSFGVEFEPELVEENPESDEASGRKACGRLLKRLGRRNMPDAIFCTTDLQAYGAMSYLSESGFRTPRDISLMGVDNLAESATCEVPLTSMEFSGPDTGAAAFKLLFEAAAGLHPNGCMISCPGRIIERDSITTRKPKRRQP